METMDVAWRRFKWETKKKVLSGKDESDRPKTVPHNQLEELVDYWNVPKIQVSYGKCDSIVFIVLIQKLLKHFTY